MFEIEGTYATDKRFDLMQLACFRELKETRRIERSIGTLGGGNHFIEVDCAEDGTNYPSA